jgi:hypothetical protein
MKERFYLAKSEDEDDGVLTPAESKASTQYAKDWIKGFRNLDLERKFPELRGLFYDIRTDSDLAVEQANY